MLGQRMRDNRLARFLAGGCHAKHRPFLPLIFATRPHTLLQMVPTSVYEYLKKKAVLNWVTACKLIQEGKRLGVHACCMMDLDHGFESNGKNISPRVIGCWWVNRVRPSLGSAAVVHSPGGLECLEGGDQNMPVTLNLKGGKQNHTDRQIHRFIRYVTYSHDWDDVSGLSFFLNSIFLLR